MTREEEMAAYLKNPVGWMVAQQRKDEERLLWMRRADYVARMAAQAAYNAAFASEYAKCEAESKAEGKP